MNSQLMVSANSLYSIIHASPGALLFLYLYKTLNAVKDVRVDIHGDRHHPQDKILRHKRSLKKSKSNPDDTDNSERGTSRSKRWAKGLHPEILHIDDDTPLPKLSEEGEAIGIITMEDVIEEILQVWKTKLTCASFLLVHLQYACLPYAYLYCQLILLM